VNASLNWYLYQSCKYNYTLSTISSKLRGVKVALVTQDDINGVLTPDFKYIPVRSSAASMRHRLCSKLRQNSALHSNKHKALGGI
jgi:hypothetical protein